MHVDLVLLGLHYLGCMHEQCVLWVLGGCLLA
jgi:hypothetical protein